MAASSAFLAVAKASGKPYIESASATPTIRTPLLRRRYPLVISAAQSTDIAYKIKAACYTSAAIVQDSDETRNGKDNSGASIAPGTHLAHIQAKPTLSSTLINYAVGRITVTA